MSTTAIVVIVVLAAVALAALAAVAVLLGSRNQTRNLKETFGPEYDRTVTVAVAGSVVACSLCW